MVILKNKKILVLVVAIVMIVVGANYKNNASGMSLACSRSEACKAAVAKEEEANKNAAAAANSANLFQNKVNELIAEIASKESEIAETTAQVEELKEEILVREKRLAAEQEALAELLVNMHFESDAEPIRILAGSTSISDLAEKAAREEVVKQQISETATQIKTEKEKLEESKSEVEALLEQQKAAKTQLANQRAEQQALVEKYQNDAEAYAEVAKAAIAAQLEAERLEKEQHPELYGGSTYTGYNTYPWQENCPDDNISYITYYNGYKIGGYVCQCVSYAGWKAYEAWGVAVAWGNASAWASGAANDRRFYVDKVPTAGSIGQTSVGVYGHVFWVESVNSDGSINITEYNNDYGTYLYSGISRPGDFGARTISAGSVWQYSFIHKR